MTIQNHIKQLLRTSLEQLNLGESGEKIAKIDPEVDFAADEKFGDLSTNIAMVVHSHLRSESANQPLAYKSPRDLAEALLEHINEQLATKNESQAYNLIEKLDVAGPGFINFTFSDQYLLTQLDRVNEKKQVFGSKSSIEHSNTNKTQNKDTNKKRKVEVEHTSPNPNKAMHLGHLRNNVTGMAIANILEFDGAQVIRDCIDNNRGIAIAKLMWGFLKFARKQEDTPIDIQYWIDHPDAWQTPADRNLGPGKFVDLLYVEGNTDVEENPESEKTVRQMVVDWEAEDEGTWKLWEHVLDYSYQGQQLTLSRLGNKWDKIWHEHEHYKEGKDLVDQGVDQGVFKQLEDGAIVTDLEKDYGLSDTILRKSDGTALYITQDLALTKLKRDTYHADQLLWVIGPEQSLAMKQMFASCAQLGIGEYDDYIHVPYGFMSLKNVGKMSSRKGNVIYIDDLLDQAVEKAEGMINNPEMSAEEKQITAEKVGVGAVKYSILRVGRNQDMAFDFEESINLNGNSGPYIQYTFARCMSVLGKAKISVNELKSEEGNKTHEDLSTYQPINLLTSSQSILSELDWSSLSIELNPEERAILNWLWRFSDAIDRAAAEYAPHYVATYIYELAQRFNSFYNKHSILGGDRVNKLRSEEGNKTGDFLTYQPINSSTNTSDQTLLRLALTSATAQVLQTGLGLLGIEAPEKM